MTRKRYGSMIAVGALLVSSGCSSPDDVATQEDDIAEYEQLLADLYGGSEVFIDGPAQTFIAAGEHLFWADASAGNPILKSFDTVSDTPTSYSFAPYLTLPSSPNPIDNLNFAASSTLVASMNEPDGANLYSTGAGVPLEKVTLPAPPFGQKWWAYAVDGDSLFVALTLEDTFVVKRWTLGEAEPVVVADLTALIAPNALGEFHGFAVSGSTLVFDEGNRIWLVDLDADAANWVQNDTTVDGMDFDASGAVFSTEGEFFRYDWGSDSVESLTASMQAGYEMNPTFAEAHHPKADAAWFKTDQTLVYIGNSGVFGFNMNTDEVWPILLNERDNSRVYQQPIALDSGTLFIKSLESSSGAIGADGPTLRLTTAP